MMTHSQGARTTTPRPTSRTLGHIGSCSCGGRCSSSSAERSPAASATVPGFDFGKVRIFPERTPVPATLFPVGDGTETLSPRLTTTVDGGAAAPSCSSGISSGAFSSIPNGQTLPASLSGSLLNRTFDMVATFVPTQAGCSSNCGEYRQYVRGQFTRNGAAVAHPLCGSNLDPTAYQEDCANIGGTTYKYGYHANRFATSYFDNPDQADGLTFHGHDGPGISGSSGDKLSMQLDFRGQLVDACNANQVLQTAEWSVAGSATVP
jgi:hypothetical protein